MKLNIQVHYLHERALRIIYQDYRSSFTKLENYRQEKYRVVSY